MNHPTSRAFPYCFEEKSDSTVTLYGVRPHIQRRVRPGVTPGSLQPVAPYGTKGMDPMKDHQKTLSELCAEHTILFDIPIIYCISRMLSSSTCPTFPFQHVTHCLY